MLYLITSAKIHFPNKVIFPGYGGLKLGYIFGEGHNSPHYRGYFNLCISSILRFHFLPYFNVPEICTNLTTNDHLQCGVLASPKLLLNQGWLCLIYDALIRRR